MEFKVYGYVSAGGDGSYGICWFTTEGDEDKLKGWDYETWCDGDGFGPRCTLSFESKEAAIKAGIPADIGPFIYSEDEDESDEEVGY